MPLTPVAFLPRNHALALAIMSYDGRLNFGLLGDYDAVPDIDVISGALEVTVGEEVRVLKAGDAYLFDSRVPHRFRNLSETPCEVVSACTPPWL